jgi:Sigma-70, region 4
VLNARERRVFEARRLAEEPMTLDELAGEFAVSRERVRQIEARAFEKVQKAVKRVLASIERPAGAAIALRGERFRPGWLGRSLAHADAISRSHIGGRGAASGAYLAWQPPSPGL